MEEILTTAAAEDAAMDTVVESSEAEVLEAVPKKRQRKPINQQKLQDNLWGWIFCLPLIIGTIWFVYSAFVMALMLSFANYPMGEGKTLGEILTHLADNAYRNETYPMVGGRPDYSNPIVTYEPLFWYKRAFTYFEPTSYGDLHQMFCHLFNTVFYMIGIPIGMILSMFFAVCMSRDIKGGNVFRVLYYIPCVASTISVVYTFKIMFDNAGVINQLFGSDLQWMNAASGLAWKDVFNLTDVESTNSFLTNPYWCQGIISKLVVIIMSVWKGLGGTIILYVAGLSGVNAATKEAAQIDGANGWQIFWKVTMPDLYPTIFYNIVTSVIGGLQIYMEPVLFFGEHINTSGYVSLVYRYGLQGELGGGKNPSAGAAYGMILAVIIFALTLFQFWLDSRKKD